jgi:hypothetical protein
MNGHIPERFLRVGMGGCGLLGHGYGLTIVMMISEG